MPIDTSKARLTLEMPSRARAQLSDLAQRSKVASVAAVIRKAVALYDLMLEHHAGGGTVQLTHKDGRRETLCIL